MKMNAKLVIGSLTVLALAACSGGGGESKKNYAASTANLEEVAQNFSRIEQSASALKKTKTDEKTLSANTGDDSVVREKSRRMEQAVANCKVEMSEPNPDAGRGNISTSLKIGGDTSCPVAVNYALSMKIDETAQKMSMGLNIEMKIMDADLADMNDVYEANIKGSLNAGAGGAGGTLTGKILSKKFGTVDVNGTLTATGNERSSKVVGLMSFTIQGEVTELGMTQENTSTGAKETYSINGKTVTKEEFTKVTAKLSFLGKSMEPSNDSSSEEAAQPY